MPLQASTNPAVEDTRGRTPRDVGSEHRGVVALLMRQRHGMTLASRGVGLRQSPRGFLFLVGEEPL